jgi:hypothetical protein
MLLNIWKSRAKQTFLNIHSTWAVFSVSDRNVNALDYLLSAYLCLLVPMFYVGYTNQFVRDLQNVIQGLILYHRRDKSKVSKTATQFVKFMGCLRCRCSAKKLKADDDENIKLKTEDYYMYRGTSSNDLNSFEFLKL